MRDGEEITYLPVFAGRQARRLGERVEVPDAVDALAAVARRAPAESAQRAAEGDEAAVRPERPVVLVIRGVGGGLGLSGRRRFRVVLRRPQDGGHVERPDLSRVVRLRRSGRCAAGCAEGRDLRGDLVLLLLMRRRRKVGQHLLLLPLRRRWLLLVLRVEEGRLVLVLQPRHDEFGCHF